MPPTLRSLHDVRFPRLAFILALVCIAASQAPSQDNATVRRDKLRAILQMQDLRTGRDALLRELLYDRDSLVRLRATLAYGSLQDTTALTDLLNNLTSAPPAIQEAAAFAIGQTAPALSRKSVIDLEHDLIWSRLDRTAARARLIEEVGKFGTENALTDLMLRIGTGRSETKPLLMSIARFAIRNIRNPDATRLALVTLLELPPLGWEAAYALQRIGDDPLIRAEVPRLVGAFSSREPLVRMQIATLLGKLRGDTTLPAHLSRAAEFDVDPAVRVAAVRSLGAFPPTGESIQAYRSALSGEDAAVVLTALSTLGGYEDTADLSPLLPAISAIAAGRDRSAQWEYRTTAAAALARIEGAKALAVLEIPDGREPLLTAGMIAAFGATGSRDAFAEISRFTEDSEPLYRRTALEALQSLLRKNSGARGFADTVHAVNLRALRSTDMAVITTAAANLGDSLLLRRESVGELTAALDRLRSPADIEAVQEICRTLGAIGDRSAAGSLEAVIDDGDAPAARAAAEALSSITGEDHRGRVSPDREPLHKDFDFAYLESLPETIAVSLETSRGTITMDWYRDAAPFTIMSMLKLAEGEGFYRGLIMHRVVPNFVIQGGDPRGDGWGGPGYSVRSEFSPLRYRRGTVGIASAGKDTEGSQFFITHTPQPHLEGRYTIIGEVTGGMEVVDEIRVGDRILDLSRKP